jgi:Uncharacterized conserved protein (DUF2075)
LLLAIARNPVRPKDDHPFEFTILGLVHGHRLNQKIYLTNAYRVLLTRARQGMVIYVPEGDPTDYTRLPEFYAGVVDFLKNCGLK